MNDEKIIGLSLLSIVGLFIWILGWCYIADKLEEKINVSSIVIYFSGSLILPCLIAGLYFLLK